MIEERLADINVALNEWFRGSYQMIPPVSARPLSLMPLNYAPSELRARHSFYSVLSLLMAGVTVVWLGYMNSVPHRHYPYWDPLWCALFENYEWPGILSCGLAIVSLIQTSRKRTLSIIAVAIVAVTYVLWMPPVAFL